MLFNSIEFSIFFPIVFFLYWAVANRRLHLRNFFLILVSYIFYGWWDWRFLSLIIISSSVDYLVGIGLAKETKIGKRRFLLLTSIFVNIGLLAFFKYFNFFTESFVEAFRLFGKEFSYSRLNIVLPVGISFYTFQTLSYSIDVYKGKMTPTKNALAFFAFVSFFPQLVAGPIERAKNLLPQFYKKTVFNYDAIRTGLLLLLWGLFKKLVIADNVGIFVDAVYNHPENYSGIYIIYATYFFAFQIYCDFSGYSDMAIGIARMLGFNLMVNFRRPYFSKSLGEFWRRWHISLSTWFRDYVYIPMGGNRVPKWRWYYNLFIVFLVSGLWHGANWTFVFWGAFHGLYMVIESGTAQRRNTFFQSISFKYFSVIQQVTGFFITFNFVVFTWIFFRANSISDAFLLIKNMFKGLNLANLGVSIPGFSLFELIVAFGSIGFLLFMHLLKRKKQLEDLITDLPLIPRWGFYFFLFFLIVIFGNFSAEKFIYFDF